MKTSKGGLSKMAIVRWDPFRELTAVQDEFNRLLSRARGGEVAERQSWMPSVDVVETQEAIELRAEVAGIEPEDINLEVEDNVLTISGERRFEQEVDEEKYYRIERRYGSFSRSLALPQSVDTDKIVARYENGILEVKVPKVEEGKVLEGVQLTHSLFTDLLQKEGVKEIDPQGSVFDPELHEAVMAEPSDEEEGIVTRVFERGYMIENRVLRPARVVVSQGRSE